MKTLELLFGNQYSKAIQDSNILVVGVGGIGCELLKCLTNSGYRNMTILDYDHVEMTNLNRQFYFRSHHAKSRLSKAEVGKQEILKKDPSLNITAIHASIFEPRFDVQFFRQFTLVFCALDNIPARQHLGRMCIIAGRQMVDGGSEGFNGQVTTRIRQKSSCYSCYPQKFTENTNFAICTIRATPTEPIHVITYGISLFKLLFGPLDSDNYLIDLIKPGQFTTASSQEDIQQKAIQLFDILFYQYIIERKDQVTADVQLFPLKYDEALLLNQIYEQEDPSILKAPDDRQQPLSFFAKLFVQSFTKLVTSGRVGELIFEKDDQDCLNFVASVTNLRTYNFTKKFKVGYEDHKLDKLKYLSIFKIKQIAGRIIPAIASTNAIAAAVQTSESNKILSQNQQKLIDVHFHRGMDKLYICSPPKPQLDCQVCSPKNVYLFVQTDMDVTTIEKIVFSIKPQKILHGSQQFYEAKQTNKQKQYHPLNKLIQQCGYPPYSSFIFKCVWKDGQRFERWIQNNIIYVIITHKQGADFVVEETSSQQIVKDQIKLYKQQLQKDNFITRQYLKDNYESDFLSKVFQISSTVPEPYFMAQDPPLLF